MTTASPTKLLLIVAVGGGLLGGALIWVVIPDRPVNGPHASTRAPEPEDQSESASPTARSPAPNAGAARERGAQHVANPQQAPQPAPEATAASLEASPSAPSDPVEPSETEVERSPRLQRALGQLQHEALSPEQEAAQRQRIAKRAEIRAEMLARRLSLTAEQQQQVQEILTKRMNAFAAGGPPVGAAAAPQHWRKRLLANRSEADDEISEVLDEQQLKAYRKFVQRQSPRVIREP